MSDINVELQEDLNITQDSDEINVELTPDLNIETATDTIDITTEDAQPINITLQEILLRETETGASTFLELTDTPDSYAAQAGKIVAVKQDETGLEYVAPNPGDITGVTAGTGLSGGGTSGNVTLSLDTTYTDTLYSPLVHNHDDRYYTEAEIDAFSYLDETDGDMLYLRKDQNLADLPDWSVAIQSLRLNSNANGEGASLIEAEDAAGNYNATNVEGILAELPDKFLEVTQDLADVNDVAAARDNLGVYSEAEAQSNFIRKTSNPTKDQGYEQNSSPDGVTADYVSNKTLHNIAIKGHPATKQVGSFWLDTTVTPSVLHIYTNGATRDIKIDFTTANSELEHQPLEYTIDVWSGNSNQMGVNGLPLVQEYKTSMGAYPVPILIDGGTF